MEYVKVYMKNEINKQMLKGKTVTASLRRNEGDIEITVGNYRITNLEYPQVLVNPAK